MLVEPGLNKLGCINPLEVCAEDKAYLVWIDRVYLLEERIEL